MTGYAFIVGACVGCGKMMTFHPHKVPSLRVDGDRKPVCRTCIEVANPKRIANGLDAFVIPDGAYEPCPEEEL
jgi:hypothetical protein